jgi:hypothetical protein
MQNCQIDETKQTKFLESKATDKKDNAIRKIEGERVCECVCTCVLL